MERVAAMEGSEAAVMELAVAVELAPAVGATEVEATDLEAAMAASLPARVAAERAEARA